MIDNRIELPLPRKDLEFPLMKALSLRRTKRKWSGEDLSNQELSDLLWAACGMTVTPSPRAKSKRTVPSGRNAQAVHVYVALKSGVYLYREESHDLYLQIEGDLRSIISNQKMMKSTPVGLIYVADFDKLKGYVGTDDQRKWFVSGTETGFISQNVYLHCAAANLSTAIIGLVDREKLHDAMQLKENLKIVYTQAVGKQLLMSNEADR